MEKRRKGRASAKGPEQPLDPGPHRLEKDAGDYGLFVVTILTGNPDEPMRLHGWVKRLKPGTLVDAELETLGDDK